MEMENRNLTNEESEKVVGGKPDKGIFTDLCPFCGEGAEFHQIRNIKYKGRVREFWHCGKCGDLTHFVAENRWEHGLIKD